MKRTYLLSVFLSTALLCSAKLTYAKESTHVEQVVNAYIQAWNSHDEVKIDSFYAPNVEWYDLAQQMTYSGKSQVSKAIIDYFLTPVDNMYWVQSGLAYQQGDTLIYEWEYGGNFTGQWGDIEIIDKRFKLKGLSVTQINSEGKITAHRDYYDMASFEQALLN